MKLNRYLLIIIFLNTGIYNVCEINKFKIYLNLKWD